jgi:hypothetical protein
MTSLRGRRRTARRARGSRGCRSRLKRRQAHLHRHTVSGIAVRRPCCCRCTSVLDARSHTLAHRECQPVVTPGHVSKCPPEKQQFLCVHEFKRPQRALARIRTKELRRRCQHQPTWLRCTVEDRTRLVRDDGCGPHAGPPLAPALFAALRTWEPWLTQCRPGIEAVKLAHEHARSAQLVARSTVTKSCVERRDVVTHIQPGGTLHGERWRREGRPQRRPAWRPRRRRGRRGRRPRRRRAWVVVDFDLGEREIACAAHTLSLPEGQPLLRTITHRPTALEDVWRVSSVRGGVRLRAAIGGVLWRRCARVARRAAQPRLERAHPRLQRKAVTTVEDTHAPNARAASDTYCRPVRSGMSLARRGVRREQPVNQVSRAVLGVSVLAA